VTAVVGGSTMFIGPVLGGFFLTMVPEVQRSIGIDAGWIRPFLSSLLLLVVILFLPGGLASFLPRRKPRLPATDGDASDGRRGEVLASRRVHPDPGETVVRLESLGKDYGGVYAAQDIDLEITGGEVVGLIGPNGA